jgi:hypothetical protein
MYINRLLFSKRTCFHTWLIKTDRYSDGAAINRTRQGPGSGMISDGLVKGTVVPHLARYNAGSS